jgi:hypothetical protein
MLHARLFLIHRGLVRAMTCFSSTKNKSHRHDASLHTNVHRGLVRAMTCFSSTKNKSHRHDVSLHTNVPCTPLPWRPHLPRGNVQQLARRCPPPYLIYYWNGPYLIYYWNGTYFSTASSSRTPSAARKCSTARATVLRLTYAGVCWRMLTYADVCWRMLTYADVYWRISTARATVLRLY